MNKFTCQKCKKEIDLNEVKVYIHKGERHLNCPHCNMRYIKVKYSTDLKRDETGKLVRTSPKIRMSKKLKRKARRLLESIDT